MADITGTTLIPPMCASISHRAIPSDHTYAFVASYKLSPLVDRNYINTEFDCISLNWEPG